MHCLRNLVNQTLHGCARSRMIESFLTVFSYACIVVCILSLYCLSLPQGFLEQFRLMPIIQAHHDTLLSTALLSGILSMFFLRPLFAVQRRSRLIQETALRNLYLLTSQERAFLNRRLARRQQAASWPHAHPVIQSLVAKQVLVPTNIPIGRFQSYEIPHFVWHRLHHMPLSLAIPTTIDPRVLFMFYPTWHGFKPSHPAAIVPTRRGGRVNNLAQGNNNVACLSS